MLLRLVRLLCISISNHPFKWKEYVSADLLISGPLNAFSNSRLRPSTTHDPSPVISTGVVEEPHSLMVHPSPRAPEKKSGGVGPT
ncbi:hypothetical protein QVD17_05233 [Tagetes erecta]|uniref:Uncharacterized protein n=1 Tax=Tagetes erecta TaxID=13708 RepID=A0AAD8LBK4_TARER|nr:hypothetical protein QVD17_05233 [Tagetes erecta]